MPSGWRAAPLRLGSHSEQDSSPKFREQMGERNRTVTSLYKKHSNAQKKRATRLHGWIISRKAWFSRTTATFNRRPPRFYQTSLAKSNIQTPHVFLLKIDRKPVLGFCVPICQHFLGFRCFIVISSFCRIATVLASYFDPLNNKHIIFNMPTYVVTGKHTKITTNSMPPTGY